MTVYLAEPQLIIPSYGSCCEPVTTYSSPALASDAYSLTYSLNKHGTNTLPGEDMAS